MPLDPAQAATWYREAAEAGNAVAISAIGRVQEQGAAGLQKSNDDAMTWYRSAAQAVDAEAMYKLAEMLSNIPLGLFGRGDKLKQIFDWYGRAANAGHPPAMVKIADYFSLGLDPFEADLDQAVAWYHNAAERDDARGICLLGLAYESGTGGLPSNRAEGLRLIRRAAARGEPQRTTCCASGDWRHTDRTRSSP
jgi:TPR repeat protein